MRLSKHHTDNEIFVIITNEDGYRFQYQKSFKNLNDAIQFQNKVENHLKNNGEINFNFWNEILPVPNSKADKKL